MELILTGFFLILLVLGISFGLAWILIEIQLKWEEWKDWGYKERLRFQENKRKIAIYVIIGIIINVFLMWWVYFNALSVFGIGMS